MTNGKTIHKLEYMKKAYQTLIDEKVDSGKLVGDGVKGEWKAETPLDKAYKDMIEALGMAIKSIEALDKLDSIIVEELDNSTDFKECMTLRWVLDKMAEVIE